MSCILINNSLDEVVRTDISKAFVCIPHDFVIAKLADRDFDSYAIRYIYFYLKNRKQCLKFNNTYSDLLDILFEFHIDP